jgi:hypothetical protein
LETSLFLLESQRPLKMRISTSGIFCIAGFFRFAICFQIQPGLRHPFPATRRQIFFSASKDANAQGNGSDENENGEKEELLESEALKWAKKQLDEIAKEEAENKENNAKEREGKKKKYVIVGAGWGGWGAAKALCESGIDADVTIIDALPDPTGSTPYLSKSGKPVEAGTRGFWKDYPNINALVKELGLEEDDIFTPFTNSSFYSPDGLEATAPVFSNVKFPSDLGQVPVLSQFAGKSMPMLPSPFGQVSGRVGNHISANEIPLSGFISPW